MRRVSSSCRFWVGLLLVLTSLWITSQDREEQRLTRELRDTVTRLNNNLVWLNQANVELKDLIDEVDSLDHSINELGQEKNGLSQEIATLEDSISGLDIELANTQAGIKQTLLEKSWILQAYKTIDNAQFLLMLHYPEDPSLLDRLAYYHRLLLQERDASLNDINVSVREIEGNLVRIQGNSQRLRENRQQLTTQEEAMRNQRLRRTNLADELRSAIRQSELDTQKLVADQERLEALLQHIAPRSMEIPVELSASPGVWPVEGTIKHQFGEPRGDGRLKWEGVYFTAEAGTTVAAVKGGRVEFAEWLRGFGMTIIIFHDEGLISLYGNCDSLIKSQGDWVEAGEPIATVGRSGGQKEIGLYFELREQNKAIDPLKWFGAQ